MSTTKLPLKLLINTTSNKVLFAEANKEVIDFLFGLLEMPLGSIINLLTNKNVAPMSGSMGNLHNSIKAIDDIYLLSNDTKVTLLDPLSAISSSLSHTTLLLPEASLGGANKKLYKCCGNSCHISVCEENGRKCVVSGCGYSMTTEVPFISKVVAKDSNGNGGSLGFVKGVVTYTIMDDLSVTPMSTISSITMLNKFNVKDLGGLKEKIVHIGIDEGLALLRASLQSRSVLTDVFLKDVK